MIFEDAWNVLKARTERNYPAALQQGRAGTQTQHNPMNMESRLANPPGRVRSQGKEQAMAQILESMKPKKGEESLFLTFEEPPLYNPMGDKSMDRMMYNSKF